MTFECHPSLAKKPFVIDLPLCRVFLENERHYPWLILVPRRSQASRLIDLTADDQVLLYSEMDHAQRVLWNTFHPTQLNVAAIGNKTPQLHIHIIARKEGDPAWPGTVWDHPIREKYSDEELQQQVDLLRSLLEQHI